MTTSIDQVEKLSDEELFKTLKGHGLNVGPITPTTRSLYEKRLKTFLESQSGGTAATVETTTGSNGNVTTTTSTQVPPSPSPKKSAPATPKASSESPRAAAMTQSLYEETTPRKSESPKMTSLSASYTTESSSDFPRIRGRAPLHRKADESTLSDESKEKKASSGSACYNFIKYLLLFVFVLVLVYFIVTMYEDKIQNVFDYIAF